MNARDPAAAREVDPEELSALYDDLIETYEREWNHHGHRSLHLAYYDDEHDDPAAAAVNTIRVLAEAAEIEAEDRVLNVGCGAGEGAVFLARRYGATVEGVDVGETQLAVAREYATEHGVGDLTTFRRDDFHDLATVEDGSVDVFWALEALSHSPDVPTVADQARRVLAPDGRLAVADLFLREPDPPDAAREKLRTVEEGLATRFGHVDELREALEDREFRTVEVRDVTDGIRRSTERRRRFSRIVSPFGGILTSVGFFSEAQVDALEASVALHDLVADGTLGYYLVTADA